MVDMSKSALSSGQGSFNMMEFRAGCSYERIYSNLLTLQTEQHEVQKREWFFFFQNEIIYEPGLG